MRAGLLSRILGLDSNRLPNLLAPPLEDGLLKLNGRSYKPTIISELPAGALCDMYGNYIVRISIANKT